MFVSERMDSKIVIWHKTAKHENKLQYRKKFNQMFHTTEMTKHIGKMCGCVLKRDMRYTMKKRTVNKQSVIRERY